MQTSTWARTAQGPLGALGGGDDRVEQFLGGLQQGLALAGAFGGQQGAAAQQQTLAGKVRGSDFGEVLVVEEGHLDGALAGEAEAARGQWEPSR